MSKNTVLFATSFITLAIILGALATHSLEKIIAVDLIVSFEKGVRYLMYSGISLLVLGLNSHKFKFSTSRIFVIIEIGTILFSGNLFLYVFHDYFPFLHHLVHLVPVGGTLMIIGWLIFLTKLARQY